MTDGAMRQLRDDEPLMIAWNKYKKSEDYLNSCKHFITFADNLIGNMWGVFMAGFNSAAQPDYTDKVKKLLALSDYLDSRLPLAKEENERVKQDEWEACYAFMFKRMNDLLAEFTDYKEIAIKLYQELYLAERSIGAPDCDRVYKLLHRFEDLSGMKNGKALVASGGGG